MTTSAASVPADAGRVIRVAVADDEPIIRTALVRCLRRQLDMEVVVEAEDAAALLELTDRKDLDVVLSDRRMPGDVPGVIRAIRARPSAPAVIVLTGFDDASRDCLEAGASSYLLKRCTASDIVNAVRDQARWRRSLLRQRS